MRSARRKITRWLQAHPEGGSTREIAEGTGLDEETAASVLEEMRLDKKVAKSVRKREGG